MKKTTLLTLILCVSLCHSNENYNALFANSLNEMKKTDQEVRNSRPINMQDMKVIDRKNTNTLKLLINKYGWPTNDLVGEDGVLAAFLIIQHASHDLEFQMYGLKIFRKLSGSTEPMLHLLPYLEDRVLMRNELPQKYGTQGQCIGGEFVLYQLENPILVDWYRINSRLSKLSEYLEAVKNNCH